MKKKFDSVKLMREIRLKLGEKYLNNPERELKELKEKYHHLKKNKSKN